jgi:DNA-binding NarL/FixJ family response regulator
MCQARWWKRPCDNFSRPVENVISITDANCFCGQSYKLVQPQRGVRLFMSNLTKRQSIIAKLVGSGLSNKQIARELAISEGTVKAHLHTIYDKLGIASRHTLINQNGLRND